MAAVACRRVRSQHLLPRPMLPLLPPSLPQATVCPCKAFTQQHFLVPDPIASHRCPAAPLRAAGNMLQGPEGSQVTLTVQPRGSSASKEVKLARQPIAFNPVDSALCSSSGERGVPWRCACLVDAGRFGTITNTTLLFADTATGTAAWLALLAQNTCSQTASQHLAGGLAPNAPDSKLGYIRVATFSKQTAENVGEALKELKSQVGSTLGHAWACRSMRPAQQLARSGCAAAVLHWDPDTRIHSINARELMDTN